jgi:hypothetical protein
MRKASMLLTATLSVALLGGAGAGPALDAPDAAQRLAALYANEARWELAALPEIVSLEEDPDPAVAAAARLLVRRYLVWGPTRPGWRERRDANRPGFEPWDRAGLRAWRARGSRR